MECTSCGHPVPLGSGGEQERVPAASRRCPSCFNYLDSDGVLGVHETEVGGRFCVRCGLKNEPRTTQCSRCGRGLEGFLFAATIVAERYLVLPTQAVLPQAGQLAVDMEKQEPCTVKVGVLMNCTTKDEIEAAGRRFALARACEHANLIRLREFSIDTKAGFVVFDPIQGRDLESIMVAEGMPWLPQARALSIGHQVLQAVDYLQNRRPMVVLNDLAPDCLAVDDGDQVHVLPLDWRDATEVEGSRRPYRAIDSYLSHPSATWDVYSTSALLHHMLTGQAPVAREAWDFPPLRSFNPQLSVELERIVAKGLASHQERYPSASYMNAELVVCFPQLREEPSVVLPRRPRPRTTGALTMTVPGRFSRATPQDAAAPSSGGRGLLRVPASPRPSGGTGFRPLRTPGPGDKGGLDETDGPASLVLTPPPPLPAPRLPVWRRVAPSPSWIHGDYGSLLPDFVTTDRRVVVGTWDGALRGLSPHEGERYWEIRVDDGTWYNLVVFHGGVVGQLWRLPTTPEEHPTFVGLQQHDVLDGTALWTHDDKLTPFTDGTSCTAVVGERLLLLFANHDNSHSRLIGLDLEGKVAYYRDFAGSMQWGGVTANGVCLWNEHDGVILVDAASGEPRWNMPAMHLWPVQGSTAPALFLADGSEMIVLRGTTPEGLHPLVAVSAKGEIGWQRCLGPAVGSYLDAPPSLVTPLNGRILAAIPWEFRGQFRNSLFQLNPVTGLPEWAADLRTPLQGLLSFGSESPVIVASTPVRQSHVWGPFSHYRGEPLGPDTARPRVGSSPMRALDPDTGNELWRSGKQEAEALSFRLQATPWGLIASGSDGRLHAYTWYHDS